MEEKREGEPTGTWRQRAIVEGKCASRKGASPSGEGQRQAVGSPATLRGAGEVNALTSLPPSNPIPTLIVTEPQWKPRAQMLWEIQLAKK